MTVNIPTPGPRRVTNRKNRTAYLTRDLRGAFLLACLTFFGWSGVAQAELYRWTTKDGIVHYGDNMPSSQAMDGYDLINPVTGETIRHIDRAKTEKELAAEAAAEQAAEKKRAAAEAQSQHDRMLLDLYVTTDDLERAKKQRLDEIDGLIAQTKNAIARADARSNGDDQPASEKKAAFRDILQLRKNLFDLKERRNEVVKQFDSDLHRFEQLQSQDKRTKTPGR